MHKEAWTYKSSDVYAILNDQIYCPMQVSINPKGKDLTDIFQWLKYLMLTGSS